MIKFLNFQKQQAEKFQAKFSLVFESLHIFRVMLKGNAENENVDRKSHDFVYWFCAAWTTHELDDVSVWCPAS